MSIKKCRGTFTPVCDTCGDELEAELSFFDAVSTRKFLGWKSRKIDGEWQDSCCACELETQQKAEKDI